MNNDDLISRKAVLDYLKEEGQKLIDGQYKKDDVIPIKARRGAILSIKAMTNFIVQLESAK